jgi:hypothetical protein
MSAVFENDLAPTQMGETRSNRLRRQFGDTTPVMAPVQFGEQRARTVQMGSNDSDPNTHQQQQMRVDPQQALRERQARQMGSDLNLNAADYGELAFWR